MRIRRTTKLLVEPPSASIGDIVFNLIIFFLACVSVQPDSGRKQTLPRSEESQQQEEHQTEVALTRTAVMLNGEAVAVDDLNQRLTVQLANKPREEDRIVIVKSRPETPYEHWIAVTGQIQRAGGIVTIQREEERTVVLPD